MRTVMLKVICKISLWTPDYLEYRIVHQLFQTLFTPRVASETVRFHNIFGKALSSDLGNQVLQAIYEHSPEVFVNGVPGRNVGGVWLAPNSCDISLVPVNYTDTMTVFPTIMPTSTVIQPTLGTVKVQKYFHKNMFTYTFVNWQVYMKFNFSSYSRLSIK